MTLLWIFLLLSVSEVNASHSTEYEFRLTNPENREIELVLNFSSFESCREARAVAEYFNYWRPVHWRNGNERV